MRLIVAIILGIALAGPLAAQDDPPAAPPPGGQGLSLIEEGTRLILRGILAELGPAWDDLMSMFDELNAYDPPERLPNGDIIIRRKRTLGAVPDDEIEL